MAPQFTLRMLLVAVAVVAGYCALLARWPIFFGFLGVPLGIFAVAFLASRAGVNVSWANVTALAIGITLLLALLVPGVEQRHGGGTSRHSTCLRNLRQISLALANYHQSHRCYPPAYVADAQGRPLVSWRVLLLPYMEQGDLYQEWLQHRDEPWDGPHNRKLSQRIMEVFRCPSDTGPDTDTSYVAVVGPGTIWPGTGRVTDSRITDGMSNTLLVVEVANSGINWMEPRDLDLTQRAPGINPKTGLGVSSHHPGCVCVLFADGRCQLLDERVSEEQLRALLTIAGGEKVELP